MAKYGIARQLQCGAEKMLFACRISNYRLTRNIEYTLLNNGLIARDLVKCFTATEKLRKDLTVVAVFLKKATSKRTFFCFSALSGTLHKDLHTFYCCLRHKFAIKALYNTEYLCIVNCGM